MKGMTAMATPKDNLGLVKWAQAWLGQAYWYGTCCYDCTASLLARKAKQYPSSYPESRMSRYKADIAAGKKCADCIGLIKGYLWTREDGKLVYKLDNRPDKGANGMFTAAKIKGAIGTLPEIPGLLLYHSGHAGVYIGGGWAIEAQGFSSGIIKTQVSKRNWTHWYVCPYMDYLNTDGTAITEYAGMASAIVNRTLSYQEGKPMMSGDDVKELQNRLLYLGYDCGEADGHFGPLTSAAVRAFQQKNGLDVDGIVGTQTRAALQTAMPVVQETKNNYLVTFEAMLSKSDADTLIDKMKALGYEATLTIIS